MNHRRLRARSGLPIVAAVVVIGGLVTACGAAASSATPAPTSTSSSVTQIGGRDFLLTAQEVETLQGEKSRFASVIQRCDRQLSAQPRPVATLALVQHYTASGTDQGSVTSDTLAPDAQMAYADGLCYLVTGDTKYAAHAQSIIDAWARTLTSAPTLQGKDAVNVDMPYMIGAASWVRAVNGWNTASFTSFLHTVVLPNAETSNPNNHGMWAVLMVASAATFTADNSLLMSAQNRWGQILQGEVTADGSMPQEAERSDTSDYRGGPDKGIKGIDYTHYTLLPASMTAKLLADAGHPVWATPGGKLLQEAFAKAAEWTLNPQKFPYYSGEAAKLIGVDNAAYFPLLLKYYPNADATQVVAAGKITADGFQLTELFAN